MFRAAKLLTVKQLNCNACTCQSTEVSRITPGSTLRVSAINSQDEDSEVAEYSSSKTLGEHYFFT